MIKKNAWKIILALGFLISFSSELRADCSFWAVLSKDKIPEEVVVGDLLNSPNSLKSLAEQNSDGWGVGYYKNGKAVVLRGGLPAYKDSSYDKSIRNLSKNNSKIIVAHVRKATSGCYKGVPNPHPFKRTKGGKDWLFGHNGIIGKDMLISIIGKEYLNNNLPETCTNNPPESWVGSELYFIYLLKNIEENNWDVKKGIRQAINVLTSRVSGDGKGFNFFLSDGETVWAFRKGRPLYYMESLRPKYCVVASRFTGDTQDNWIEVPEGCLVVMKKGAPIELIQIMRL